MTLGKDEYTVLAALLAMEAHDCGAQPDNEEAAALFGAFVDCGFMVKERATSDGVEEDFFFVTDAGQSAVAEWAKTLGENG